MSIIHDALKKVQASLDRKHGRHVPLAEERPVAKAENIRTVYTPPISAQDRASASAASLSPKLVFFLGNAVLIALGIIIVLLLKLSDRSPQVKSTPSPLVQQRLNTARSVSQTVPVQPVATATPSQALQTPAPQKTAITPPPASEEYFELGGIMLMGEQRVALINGEAYELGEHVNGKRIVNITLKEVSLLDEKNGTVTTLKAKNR